VFGSLLLLRFVPSIEQDAPPVVHGWLAGPGRDALRDPQALLNPDAAAALRASVAAAFPNAPDAADQVFATIRDGLATSLDWVFVGAALCAVAGVLATLFMRDSAAVHRQGR
jgi:hypothetical protein